MNDKIDDAERRRAEADLRHRTANIFQLLSALARMRSQRAGEPEARRQLMWLADSIGSLGTLERQRHGEGVDMAVYLAEMAPIWRRRHGPAGVEVSVAAQPLAAPDAAASSLGLIAQELVCNALTHGYSAAAAGRVRISLGPVEGGAWELVVSDDGQGFAPGGPDERFGLWFVRSLAAQVRGEFALTSAAGVTARLRFRI